MHNHHVLKDYLSSILNLIELTDFASEENIMQYALNEAERLSKSSISYFHFVNQDQKTIQLCKWSTATLTHCYVGKKESHYPIDQAGVWVDCIRKRRTVIHNDYQSLSHKKGLPDGHVKVIREMAVPVVESEKIVAILGVGNKPTEYDQFDVDTITLFAKSAWHLIQKKRFNDELGKQQRTLEEANIALKVLLKKRGEEKTNLEKEILKNIAYLIDPYLAKLNKISTTNEQQVIISILESNIKEITSSFSSHFAVDFTELTPAEIQVANLIKQGKRTKEIAEVMNLSPGTISIYRKNIRKKLGLANQRVNLHSFLASYP